MSLRYLGNELYKLGPNTVISFYLSCVWFLFVGYSVTEFDPCLVWFLFILCHSVPTIFGTICGVFLKI